MEINQRVIADHARSIAMALLDLVAPNYREELHHDIWEAFTEVVRIGLECYEIERRRMAHRLNPSEN
jgi:hypothetical protein